MPSHTSTVPVCDDCRQVAVCQCGNDTVKPWDVYAASAASALLNNAIRVQSTTNVSMEDAFDKVYELAAEFADVMMEERKKRFPNT